MLQFEYSNHIYFVRVPVINLKNDIVCNPFQYFKFENRDEWFRTDYARPIKDNYSYYSSLKKYLDNELNLYLRKQKLQKLYE
jgi:hypothetical protein